MSNRSIFIWGPFLAIVLLGLIIIISLDSQTRANPVPLTDTASDTVEQELVEDGAAAASVVENATESENNAAELSQEPVENPVEAVGDTVNDGIAEITTGEILEGEPPVESGVALSTGQTVDLGLLLQQAFNNVSTAIGNITDTTSAEAALPTLETATESISNVATLASFLSEEARAALGNFATARTSDIQSALEAANNVDGVADIISPAAEALSSAISELSN